jgi:hypothetical protein
MPFATAYSTRWEFSRPNCDPGDARELYNKLVQKKLVLERRFNLRTCERCGGRAAGRHKQRQRQSKIVRCQNDLAPFLPRYGADFGPRRGANARVNCKARHQGEREKCVFRFHGCGKIYFVSTTTLSIFPVKVNGGVH